MEASQESSVVFDNASYSPPTHRHVTYRDTVYAALEAAKKNVAELENLKLIVDATPALGQLSEQSVRYPGGSF